MTQDFIVRSVRKIVKPSVTSACLSVNKSARKTQLPLYGFSRNLKIFFKSVQKLQVSLKFDKNNGYFTRRRTCICDNTKYRWNLLTMRNVSDKSCRENQNTHFVFSDFLSFLLKSCRYCDNMKQYCAAGKLQVTEWSNTVQLASYRWQSGAILCS